MENIATIIQRSNDILKTEGLYAILKRITDYVTSSCFKLEYFYLYEQVHGKYEESRFLPRIHGLSCKIVKSNEEADALAKAVGTDFRRHILNSGQRLDAGAIAFCFFAGDELVHIGWIATTPKAKKAVDHRPYKVDFENHQAWTGGVFTPPKFRGQGLMAYGYYVRQMHLKEHGYATSKCIISVNNTASNKAHNRFNPKILAKARHFKLFWWESWKETGLQ